jgi:hypothetical protein
MTAPRAIAADRQPTAVDRFVWHARVEGSKSGSIARTARMCREPPGPFCAAEIGPVPERL